jgi:hypothetical protein
MDDGKDGRDGMGSVSDEDGMTPFDDDRLLAYALGLEDDAELEAALAGDEALARRLESVRTELGEVEAGLDRLVPAPPAEYGDPSTARWRGLRSAFEPPPSQPVRRRRLRRTLIPSLGVIAALVIAVTVALQGGSAGEMGASDSAAPETGGAESLGAPDRSADGAAETLAAQLARFGVAAVARAGAVDGARQEFEVVRLLKGQAPERVALDIVDGPLAEGALALVLLDPTPDRTPTDASGDEERPTGVPTPAPTTGSRERALLDAAIEFSHDGAPAVVRPLAPGASIDDLPIP